MCPRACLSCTRHTCVGVHSTCMHMCRRYRVSPSSPQRALLGHASAHRPPNHLVRPRGPWYTTPFPVSRKTPAPVKWASGRASVLRTPPLLKFRKRIRRAISDTMLEGSGRAITCGVCLMQSRRDTVMGYACMRPLLCRPLLSMTCRMHDVYH